MTETTKASGGIPAGVSDSTQLLCSGSLDMRVKALEFELVEIYRALCGDERKYRDTTQDLHRKTVRNHLIIGTIEVAGIWAIALLLIFKA